MPKVVDHHARRTQIAEALMRVAGTDGLQAVSLRHVAREAGVSTGMVQHYFRTKDEMMTFALRVVSEHVEARLAAGADPQRTPSPRDGVRTLLLEMLPIDDVRHREGQVGLAFHAYAAIRPHVAEALRGDSELMVGFVAERIAAARDAGDAPAGPDVEHEARMLLALVEGLSMHVLGQGQDPAVALATFEAQLDRIFDPQAGSAGR